MISERGEPAAADADAGRIEPAWFSAGAGIWADLALGVAGQAMCVLCVSLLAAANRGEVTSLVRGWGWPLAWAVPRLVQEMTQVLLNLWLLQGSIQALTEGLRDFEMPRPVIFVFLAAPPLLVLIAGFWDHVLISGAITNLVLVGAVGLLSAAPPEAAFSPMAAAKALGLNHRIKALAAGAGGVLARPSRRSERRPAAAGRKDGHPG